MKKWLVLLFTMFAVNAFATQASISISNGTGAQVRTAINNAHTAITTNQSGNSSPSPTYANQWWVDTSTSPPTLKIRNNTNTSWLTVATLNTTVSVPSATAATNATNADTIDTYHASLTPGASQIPVLDASGHFPLGSELAIKKFTNVMDFGSASVNKTSIFRGSLEASLTANAEYDGTTWNRMDITKAAYKIDVAADHDPQLLYAAAGANPISWTTYKIWTEKNDGASSGLNADMVDGYHATTTPTLNNIPVADQTGGRLAWGWKPAFRGALVYPTANITINSSTYNIMASDAEVYDTDGLHDNITNNGRITIPAGVSRIRLTGMVEFTQAGVGYRFARFYKNGAPFGVGSATGTIVTAGSSDKTYVNIITPVINVTPGDYFELIAWQNTGGPLNVIGGLTNSTAFGCEIIE